MERNQDNNRTRFLSVSHSLFLIKIFLLTTMTHQSDNTSSTSHTITVITTHKRKTFYAIAYLRIDCLKGICQIKISFGHILCIMNLQQNISSSIGEKIMKRI